MSEFAVAVSGIVVGTAVGEGVAEDAVRRLAVMVVHVVAGVVGVVSERFAALLGTVVDGSVDVLDEVVGSEFVADEIGVGVGIDVDEGIDLGFAAVGQGAE